MRKFKRAALAEVAPLLPDDPKDPLARCRVIMDLQVRGAWSHGTKAQLARKWGLAEASLSNYTHAASLHLQLLGDRDAIIRRVIERVDRVLDGKHGGEVVQAGRLLLEAVGALKRGKDDVEELPEEQLVERMKVVFARPDRVTARALRETGWVRLDTEGAEVVR